MNENPFQQDKIYFDDDSHSYFEKETGTFLISPSTIIKKYSHPFDPDGSILKRCAEKKGISPQELKAEWRKMGADSIVKGHSIHDSFEKFIKTGVIQDDDNKDIIQDFHRQIPIEGNLYPEITLYDLDYKIAGRTDLIEIWWDNIANVYDFKTNKKITKYSFGKYMLPPLTDTPDANFFHYELQLSLYALMLENKGYCPKSLNLLWINPKRKIQAMPVQYRRDTVIKLLNHYNNK